LRSLPVADVRQHIASGNVGPLYLILGSDEDEKTRLAGAFVDLIEPDLRAFNVDRLYGGEADAQTLVDAARTLPLMAPRRVVLLLHAERLLMPKRDDSDAAKKDLEVLERYLKAPVESSTMVFVAGNVDERRSIVKLLIEVAAVVTCSGPADVGSAARWISKRVAQEGMAIDPAAAHRLAELVCSVVDRKLIVDMARLHADVERLLLYAAGRTSISRTDVDEVLGGPDAQDVWAVVEAIRRGDAGKALRQLSLLLEAGAVPYAILGGLAWFVRDSRNNLPPARLAPAVEAVLRTDLLLKTSTGDPRAMLERLVVELCGR
jgi:DNA polymerase III subunit delta